MEVVVILVLVLALVTVFSGVKTVPQGQEWTVECFGKYTRTLEPGLSLITPFFDRIGKKLSMMETVLEIPTQDVITRDNAPIRADGVIFFQVIDTAAAAYGVSNLVQAIQALSMTNLRAVVGSMDMDDVLSNRDGINHRMLSVVDAAASTWGIKVTRIEIKDLTPPHDITEAMALQLKADRMKRAEILEAEGQRQSAILRAEGEKQGAILQAEGRREAAYRDAEAREREAEAEAKATQMVSDAVANGNVNALNYFVAQKYVMAMEKMAASPNQKLLMMPYEATGIISSLSGIAELTKSAFNKS